MEHSGGRFGVTMRAIAGSDHRQSWKPAIWQARPLKSSGSNAEMQQSGSL
jgi:hypothetical protein